MKERMQKILVVLLVAIMSVSFIAPKSNVRADEAHDDGWDEFTTWSPTAKELKENTKQQVELLKKYQFKLKPGDACYYKFKLNRKGNYIITYSSDDVEGNTRCYLFDGKTYGYEDGKKQLFDYSGSIYVDSPDTKYIKKEFNAGDFYLVFRSKDGTGTFNFKIEYDSKPIISESDIVLLKGKKKRLFIKANTCIERPTWKGSNSSIASVVTKGAGSAEVTAKKYGTAYATAYVDGKNLKCKIRVVDPVLNKTSIKLKPNKTYKLKVSKGSGNVTWRSMNNKVATVSNGKVKARKKGTAYIKAICNGKQMQCKVTVK